MECSQDDVSPRKDIERLIEEAKAQCRNPGCHVVTRLRDLAEHESECPFLRNPKTELDTIRERRKNAERIINRSTFTCPLCGAGHLPMGELVTHTLAVHHDCREPVVCPICVSMPWGDPTYHCVRYLHHLEKRHHFEYDTYTDFGMTEDEMIQLAMSRSLSEQ